MKLQVLLLAAIMAISTSYGQSAKSLLDDVSSKVKGYDNIKIDFKYTLSNTKENVKQETRGDVTLQGDLYLLHMLGTTNIFDGVHMYVIVPEDEEVTISKYDPNDNKAITPSKMLTFYEQGYNYKMDIQQNVTGRMIQFVKLIPIDTNAEIKDILLGIDKQTKHIYKLIQTDANGTQYILTVNSFKTNQTLSKTLFTFDEAKYKEDGYYINRLD